MDDMEYGSRQEAAPESRADVSDGTKELVAAWQKKIIEASTHWQKQFDLMRLCQKMVRGKQWVEQTATDERYVANILQRQVSGRTAAVYARNARFVASPRKRLEFALWDGNEQTLAAANQAFMQAMHSGQPPPPEVAALINDVAAGHQSKQRAQKIGKTLEVLFNYYIKEGQPRFKTAAKQLVRRTRINGVGYIKVGFQRSTGRPAATEAQISDARQQIGVIEALMEQADKGELDSCMAQKERLRTTLETLQAEEEIVLREGLVFDFPASTSIIVSKSCSSIVGFVNAEWIVHEFKFSAEKIRITYEKDIKGEGREHADPKNGGNKGVYRVWEIYDLTTQQTMTMCEGYCDWLIAPKAPDVWLEQFHPFQALAFNEIEDEENPYPLSDIELLMHQQLEMNRAREAVRQHRIANRPAWLGPKGYFPEEDKNRLSTHASGEYIELAALSPTDDADIRSKLQSKPTAPIDQATYETDSVFQDILRVSGDQEANLGGTAGGTATESTIAENSRMSSIQSNKDELDDFLSEVARMSAQVLILEMSDESVKKIVGPGAFWPTMDRRSVAEEVALEVLAGSTGRPNQALRVAMIERVAPFLQQAPNLNPTWWVKQLIQALDDSIDPTDAILDGMPSIIAMNANKQASTGDPMTDPNMQGGQGGNNAPQAPGTAGGGQPAFDAAAPQTGMAPG